MASKEEIVIVIGWKHVVVAIVLIFAAAMAWPHFVERFGPSLSLSTDKPEYAPGDTVKIEGHAAESMFTPLASEPVSIEVRGIGSIVWIDQVNTDSSGYFTSFFTLREDSLPSVYEVYASVSVAQGYVTFAIRA